MFPWSWGKLKNLVKAMNKQTKELLAYLFFGGLTTLINIVSYGILNILFDLPVAISNIIAWFLSVLFAYATNRKYVFHSEKITHKEILKECINFFVGRISTGILDTIFMVITVTLLNLPNFIMKITSNIIVIILNYIISKLIVFNKKSEK